MNGRYGDEKRVTSLERYVAMSRNDGPVARPRFVHSLWDRGGELLIYPRQQLGFSESE